MDEDKQEIAKSSPNSQNLTEEDRWIRLAENAETTHMTPEAFAALESRLGEPARGNPRLKALMATEKPEPSEYELSDEFIELHKASEAGDDDTAEAFDFNLLKTHPADNPETPGGK